MAKFERSFKGDYTTFLEHLDAGCLQEFSLKLEEHRAYSLRDIRFSFRVYAPTGIASLARRATLNSISAIVVEGFNQTLFLTAFSVPADPFSNRFFEENMSDIFQDFLESHTDNSEER